jgi:hypothetical protein
MKITIDKAVLEQALDALEKLDDYVARIEGNDRRYGSTIVAMHSALAQPAAQQEPAGEPIAWHTEDHLKDKSATTYSKDMMYRWKCKGWPVTPHYTRPAVPLTDEQIKALCKEPWVFDTAKQWVRIIEAAHKIGGAE